MASRAGFRRQGEGQPDIPAFRTVLGTEFIETFQIDIGLHLAGRDEIADLRPDAEDTRLEITERGAVTIIAGELLVVIAGDAGMDLLGQEFRGGQNEMAVYAVLVVRVLVLEIVGDTARGREFISRMRIEIGVAETTIDRAMANAEIG